MQELEALKAIDDLFDQMEAGARVRTFHWLSAKYALPVAKDPQNSTSSESAQPSRESPSIAMTAKAIATTLRAESGADLAQSAAAYLTIVQNKEAFSRQALLDTMKTATGFFKPTFRKNLSAYLDTLCKNNILIEVSADTYALKAGPLAHLEQRLASSM